MMQKVTIEDLTIREGSQMHGYLRNIPTHKKLEIVKKSITTGIQVIELTALAPGEWFSDRFELIEGVKAFSSRAKFRVLYFNPRGLNELMTLEECTHLQREGKFHTALTDKYRKDNYSQNSEQEILTGKNGLNAYFPTFREHHLNLDTILLSCICGDSSEKICPEQVLTLLDTLIQFAGEEGFTIKKVILAETSGCGSADDLNAVFHKAITAFPETRFCAHIHTTPEEAPEKIDALLEIGVTDFEGTWGGIGGSPKATAPEGNMNIQQIIEGCERNNKQHQYHLEKGREVIKAISEICSQPVF